MKKSIIGGLAVLLSSCLTFHGGVDLAYVPTRIDDEIMKNEFKVASELTVGLDVPADGFGGIPSPLGESTIYATVGHTFLCDTDFELDNKGYEVYVGWRFKHAEIYSKLLSTEEDSREEIGVKINF